MLDFGRGSALPLHRKKMLTERKARPRSFHAFARTDKTKIISLSFVFFVCLMLCGHHLRQPIQDDAVTLGEATVWGRSDIEKQEYKFVIVTDLDQMSKVKAQGKPTWRSILKFGMLHGPTSNLELSWSEEAKLTTHIAESNRGLELSELIAWQGKLYTFDDRSGIAFEVLRKPDEMQYECIPRYILTEGDGAQPKGQKTEWATVKDGSLYVGSFGKEYTKNGVVVKRWNLWINIISPSGIITHVNWEKQYELLRKATGSSFPGYMVHEAIHWDPHTRQWFVLPRRVSSDPYDEKLDEKKGSNLVLVVDEYWTSVKSMRVGPLVPERGWSSFKFLPGSRSSVIVALKTAEDEDKSTGEATQESFITVFDLDGKELIPQTKIPGDYKYEGIEFI